MDAAGTLRALLDEAHQSLRAGDAAEAERRAKAVSAIVADYAAAAAAQGPEEDVEAERAEFFGRLHRLFAAESAGASVEELERIAAGEAGV